jgi:DnaJ family protein C protein 3
MGIFDYPAFLTDLHNAEFNHQKSKNQKNSIIFHHSKSTKSLLLFLIIHQIYDVLLITKVSGADSAAKQHIDQGNKLLAAGSLSDALTHYNEAVDAEPDNYQARYRRATCLLALGRSKAAVPDLDETIKLKPEFWQARQQRANILLKQGKFDLAAKDYEACSIHSGEAREQLSSLKTTKQHFENAKVYASRGYHDRALKSLDKIKEITPWFSEMRELRANCFELFGETQNAINELKPMIQLSKHTAPETYLRLAKLYYIMPDVPQALDHIRECLKIDPDHKLCFAFYKVAKKIKQTDGSC